MSHRIRNLTAWERAPRILLGLVALGIGLTGRTPELVTNAALWLGWYPLATGLIGWSPIRVVLRAGAGR